MSGPGFPSKRALVAAAALGAALLAGPAVASMPPTLNVVSRMLRPEEVLRLGERIYRDGVLPSGKPLVGIVQGDIKVEGTMFSCTSCHMRGGLGSYEGRVITLPTNGKQLYEEYDESKMQWSAAEKNFLRYRDTISRPPYTDVTLARVLREGKDPTDRELDAVMPRYILSDSEMSILIQYLKGLSWETPPGVSEFNIKFATVIAGDVSQGDRDAMLLPMKGYIRDRNNMGRGVGRRTRMRATMEGIDLATRGITLSQWVLTGPPDTWRAQLDDYYSKDPVFAMLGGISSGEWKPIHDFCEANRIPCLFPITDFPVISKGGWYTIYFNKGLYQEGEAAARTLKAVVAAAPGTAVIQVSRAGREGAALSAGFQDAWRELGLKPPKSTVLKRDQAVTPQLLRRLTAGSKRSILLLWTGAESFKPLAAISADSARPQRVYLASGLLKGEYRNLPERVREFTYMTYPYRLPQDEAKYNMASRSWLAAAGAPANEKRISTRMFSLCMTLAQGFGMMRQNIYRENFIDSISVLPDQKFPDFERLSFGPGQQFASKGCYIVQVSPGADPVLVKKSDWVTH